MASLIVKQVNGPGAQWLVYCLIVGALAAVICSSRPVVGQEQLTVESRQQKETAASENELADTISYLEKLEKLDKYWSEVARPRFGRSQYKQRRNAGLRFLGPQRVKSYLGVPQQQQQQQHQSLAVNDPIRFKSLLDLVNARMSQRYNSDAAY